MEQVPGHYHNVDPWDLPPFWNKPVRKPRRARFHDYTARCIYLVTLTKHTSVPPLSTLVTDPAGTELTEYGEIVEDAICQLPIHFDHCRILWQVIMPDHVHIVIFVQKKTAIHLGKIVGHMCGDCTRALRESGWAGKSFFNEGYHDHILYARDALQNFIDYVSDNPRRAILRRQNPDLFTRGLLITRGELQFKAFGNIFLLKNPLKSAVRLSRRFSPEETEAKKREWRSVARNGGVLVSPFISPAEKEVRDEALAEGAPIIIIAPRGFGAREKPGGNAFELCAQGRLLILSHPGIYSLTGVLTRAECLEMNRFAALIAGLSQEEMHVRKQ